ncbi:MAG: glycosyltransferase family 9 protein [Elusimicrobia bacterium]|nr:glycosyltransferase family 9 protein [Elusimicrobiota bacterium]
MDILLIKAAALGDVLRTTTVARRLKRRYPESRITWVTARAALPLLEGNPDLERVLPLEDAPRLERRYDLVLSLEEDLACAGLARAACRGELVGVYEDDGLRYTPSSALYYGMSALNRDPDGSLTTADRLKAANRLTYAQLWLTILGLPHPGDPRELAPVLALSDAERRSAARAACWTGAKAKLSRAIALNPGAGARWPSKQLSPEAAARLAAALAALGRPVLLVGGPDEADRNRRIAEMAPGTVDAGTGRGLREFAGLLSWCCAVVTTDSLALHVATALRRPTVALIGPTSSAELDVFGLGAKLAAPGCDCFYRARCSRERSCLDSLDPTAVAAALAPWIH